MYGIKSFMFIFVLIILGWSVICPNFSKHGTLRLYEISIYSWIFAYLLSVIVALILHFLMYRITRRKINKIDKIEMKKFYIFLKKDKIRIFFFIIHFYSFFPNQLVSEICQHVSNKKEIFKRIKDKIRIFFFTTLYLLVSPDYLFSKIYKGILEKSVDSIGMETENETCDSGYKEHINKKARKLFIINSNWANIIVTCVFILFLYIVSSTKIDIVKDVQVLEFIMLFLLFHTFSRAIEIVIAFYKDVTVTTMTKYLQIGKRHSSLKRGNRISLAIHSYLEITLLFGMVYFVNSLYRLSEANSSTHLYVLKLSKLNDSLLENILYSFSLTAFNISFDPNCPLEYNILHVTQVLVGMTLVILSIANYLGLKDTMSIREKSDFKDDKYI